MNNLQSNRKRYLWIISLVSFLLLVFAACGGNSDSVSNGGTGNVVSPNSDTELVRAMGETCFMYDTQATPQSDGSYISGEQTYSGMQRNMQFKDVLYDVVPREVSRADNANGIRFKADVYVRYLAANVSGTRWTEQQKSYNVYIANDGTLWEGLVSSRTCGRPAPPKPTTEAEAINASVASSVNFSVVDKYLAEENDQFVLVIDIVNSSEKTWNICMNGIAIVYRDQESSGYPDGKWDGGFHYPDCISGDYYALQPGETQIEIPLIAFNQPPLVSPNKIGAEPNFRQICVRLFGEGGGTAAVTWKLSQSDLCSNSVFDYEPLD